MTEPPLDEWTEGCLRKVFVLPGNIQFDKNSVWSAVFQAQCTDAEWFSQQKSDKDKLIRRLAELNGKEVIFGTTLIQFKHAVQKKPELQPILKSIIGLDLLTSAGAEGALQYADRCSANAAGDRVVLLRALLLVSKLACFAGRDWGAEASDTAIVLGNIAESVSIELFRARNSECDQSTAEEEQLLCRLLVTLLLHVMRQTVKHRHCIFPLFGKQTCQILARVLDSAPEDDAWHDTAQFALTSGAVLHCI